MIGKNKAKKKDKSKKEGGKISKLIKFDNAKNKKKIKDTIALYDELQFSDSIKNESSYCRKLHSRPMKIGIDFIGSYDGDKVNFYYLLQGMPEELFIDFKERLRRECKGTVKLNFITSIDGHNIEWESSKMKSKLRILKQVGDEKNSKSVDAYNLHENISDIGRQARIEQSLNYLARADKQRGRALVKVEMLMVVSGVKGEDFDDSIKSIELYCKHIGLNMTRVLYEIPGLLSYFSPFSKKYTKDIGEVIPNHVMSDEIIARFTSYNQGTVGNRGIYFGTDITSTFPVLKVVKPKDDTAENWLITAETGGGKSHMLKGILLQLIGLGYNGTIMDIEGFEYTPMANFLSHDSKVVVINMAEGSGNYFDPVPIADKTGIDEIDGDAKNLSVDFTLSVFKVLLGRVYEEDIWVDAVINDAVGNTYSKAGVTEDSETWEYSKELTLQDVYNELKGLRYVSKVEGYLNAVEKSVAIVSRYFEEGGTRSHIFKDRVVVDDIIDADLIVCSFGLAGKTPQSIDQIQVALMQLGASHLSHQRSIYSKAQGKFNFKVWEEFQRWGKFPDSDKTLGVALTGGRKLGDVNIVVTNVVKDLLDDDRFGIFSNVTSFLIGAISDEKVRKEFCDRMSIPHMKGDLDEISKASRLDDTEEGVVNSSSNNPYTYSFLCGLDRNKYSIVKMVLPNDIGRSKLFKTGVDLTKAKK